MCNIAEGKQSKYLNNFLKGNRGWLYIEKIYVIAFPINQYFIHMVHRGKI